MTVQRTLDHPSTRVVLECAVCGNTNLRSVLHLGSSPPTCAMLPVGSRQWTAEVHYPLELLYCDECTLAQLSVIPDPSVVFAPDYPYQSGNSPALHRNFEDLARQASVWFDGLGEHDLVVDIGANDGTLLSKFEDGRTVGVEPTAQADRIDADDVWPTFFTKDVAADIREAYGPAKVITACNVLAHVEDIDDVMSGIELLLADDGILIAENHDLASVVDGGQWDTVYHEHLRFYSPHSFAKLLERHGLGAREWKDIPTHGGSFRMIAGRGSVGIMPPPRDYDFAKLAHDAVEARANLRREIDGTLPYGIGATARATTIINYCGLDVEDIPCVYEVAGSDKIGHYIPGTRIPVRDEAEMFENQPLTVLLFSWHLADVIVPKLRERGYGEEIIVPLPTLRYA